MTRCPQCLKESMRPDLLTCGRHLVCTHCGGVWVPGSKMRKECESCGRQRCPWRRYGPAHCDRWMPIRRAETSMQQLLFGEVGDGA